MGCCITADGTGTASVADGKPGLMVGWLLDLIDERDGVVRSGDLGFAVGIGDQDVGAQPERAGPLTGVPRAERQGRAEVEPVGRGGGPPQCLQDAGVGLGFGLVLLRQRVQHQGSAHGGLEARSTADHAETCPCHCLKQIRDDGLEIRPVGRVRGQRYPLTINGTKTAWQRMRATAGVKDFRFHDYRHDFGTKLLRDSGNLKLVQKAMNHRDIKSTMRYAHVLDEDVAAAVERVAKSQKKSQTKLREVG